MQKQTKKVVGFNIFEVIIIIIISCTTSILATGIISVNNNKTKVGTTYASLLEDENVKSFLDTYAQVTSGYYQNVDRSKVIDSAVQGMMSYLGDSYTSYLNSNDTSALNKKLAGTYTGIGVSLSDEGIIQEVYVNTPAEEVGLMEGDKIISVNDTEITGLKNSEISNMINTSKNSAKIKITRNNETFEFDVPVKELLKPSTSTATIKYNDHLVGYIKIASFSSTLAQQVNNSLNKLEKQNIESLILDLRGNGGGFLAEATTTAGLFLEKGKVIYSLEDKDGKTTYYDEDDVSRNYPVVVLIDGTSASASEILAAALKDSYNAIIVGTTSFGKGKVQQTHSLSDGTMVKYTSAKWLRPNGECVDGVGITPDYSTIDKVNNNQSIPTSDAMIAKAIEVLYQ